MPGVRKILNYFQGSGFRQWQHFYHTWISFSFAVLEWTPSQIRLSRFRFSGRALELKNSLSFTGEWNPIPAEPDIQRLKTLLPSLDTLDIVLVLPMLRVLYRNQADDGDRIVPEGQDLVSIRCCPGPVVAYAKKQDIQQVENMFKQANLHLNAIYHGMFEWLNVPLSLQNEHPDLWFYQNEHYTAMARTENSQLQDVRKLDKTEDLTAFTNGQAFYLFNSNGKPGQPMPPAQRFEPDIESHPYMQKETLLAAGAGLGYCDAQFFSCNYVEQSQLPLFQNRCLQRVIKWTTIAWMVLIAVQVLAWGAQLFVNQKYKDVSARYELHKRDITRLESKKAELALLDQRIQTAETFFSRRTRVGWLLSQIAHTIPAGCWLVKCEKINETSTVMLEGFGRTQKAILDFVHQLKNITDMPVRIRAIKSIEARDLRGQPVTTGIVQHFIIELEE